MKMRTNGLILTVFFIFAALVVRTPMSEQIQSFGKSENIAEIIIVQANLLAFLDGCIQPRKLLNSMAYTLSLRQESESHENQEKERKKTMSDQEISAEFPFESKYIDVYNSKIHYIEEGSGDPILFLHGSPSSSYIWRNIIPHLTSKGLCIAPDLIGMGKSDKPDIEYTFFDHARYIEGFIEKKRLRNITLVTHDWGSALGFHYAMRNENNVKGIVFMEAIIKPLTWNSLPEGVATYFKLVRDPKLGRELIINQNILFERILRTTMIRVLTEEEYNFYSSPFKDPASRKPLLRFLNDLPIEGKPEDVTAAVQSYEEKLKESHLPKLMFYATPGSIVTPELIEWCKKNLPNLKTVDIGPGTHFLQEDNPHLIGEEIASWIDDI